MTKWLIATVLAVGIWGTGSFARADHERGIAGLGPFGVVVNGGALDRLDRQGDIQIFRLALEREFHRRYGAESLLRQPTHVGSGQQNDWSAEEAMLDRMIRRVAQYIQEQEKNLLER